MVRWLYVWAYRFLAHLALVPAMAAVFSLFLFKAESCRFFGRKLGLGLPEFGPKKKNGRIWLHAVSVGEISSCMPLIEIFESRGAQVIVSVDTYAAYRLARKKLGRDILCFPFDLEWISGRFLNKYRPDLVLICEVEIWPAFAWQVARRDIPLFSVSGRMVERDFVKYRKIRWFLKHVLSCYTGIYMQTEAYAKRMERLFAHPNLRVAGILKFDARPRQERSRATGLLPRGMRICAASTHRGDEKHIVPAFKKLLRPRPEARLIIAPRHVERASEIGKILRENGLAYALRSDGRPCQAPVFILDSIGELNSVFSHCDLVIMGGSFAADNGGHNVIEPALYGKCVLCGPHMENFMDVSQIFLSAGALYPTTKESLAKDLIFLSQNPDEAWEIGKRALALTERHRGASQRIANLVMEFL